MVLARVVLARAILTRVVLARIWRKNRAKSARNRAWAQATEAIFKSRHLNGPIFDLDLLCAGLDAM